MSETSRVLIEDAKRRYKAGFRARAARLCRRIPKGDAYHGEALGLLGVIQGETGELEQARATLREALGISLGNASAWRHLGLVRADLGDLAGALTSLRRAVMLTPDNVDALRGLAPRLESAHRGGVLRRCVLLAPMEQTSYTSAGLHFRESGDFDAAARQLSKALMLVPRDTETLFRLANVFLDAGDTDSARSCFLRTLVVEPRSGAARNNLGLIAFGKEDFGTAEEWFAAATKAAPGLAEAWVNHARAGRNLDPGHDPRPALTKGIILNPSDGNAVTAFAAASREIGWIARSIAIEGSASMAFIRLAVLATEIPGRDHVLPWLRRAVVAGPDDAVAWHDLGVEAGRNDDLEPAIRYHSRAICISDSAVSAHRNKAFALLAQERFEEGWRAHTRRLSSTRPEKFQRFFEIPEWDGKLRQGQHVLLWGEQGIGDEVQFATLLPHVLRAGTRVTLITEPRLRPLFKRSFPSINVPEVNEPDGRIEDHHGAECHLAIGDLPHRLALFHGGDADPEPWIIPDPHRTADLRRGLQARHPGQRLVGITWRSVAPKTGARRTIAPALWKDVAATPGISLVALQYGVSEEDLAEFEAAGIRIDNDHGVDPLESLDDLAALVAAMDLVICPTNNTVHFAGALGMPCWVLLNPNPDWRWGRSRDGSLWYPNTRVFRQRVDEGWPSVLTRVSQELHHWKR